MTPSDAPCKGVRPIGVSIPNIAFVEGDPVALENFLDLIANLLGTQERPIGLLFQGESLLTSTQGFIEAPGLICLAAARRSMRNLWLNIGSAAKNVQNTGDRSAVLRECPNCRHAEGVREAQGGAKR